LWALSKSVGLHVLLHRGLPGNIALHLYNDVTVIVGGVYGVTQMLFLNMIFMLPYHPLKAYDKSGDACMAGVQPFLVFRIIPHSEPICIS
jgi:hypothetical protein